MPLLRRVYGQVDDPTFYAARDRALNDPSLRHLQPRDRVAAAFAALIKGYARGYDFHLPQRVKVHAPSESAKIGGTSG